MKKKTKKRVATAAVTTVASASVLVGGLFASPADLIQHSDQSTAHNAVVQMLDDDADDAGMDELDGEEERRRGGIRSRMRRWILQLPIGVRAIVGVPLWCVGWAMLTGLSALWNMVLSPIAGTVVGWLCLALLLLGVFALTAKAMFPTVPLRKILNKRNVSTVLIGVAALGALNTLMPYVWDDYDKIAGGVRLTGSFLVVLVAVWSMAARELRRRQKLVPAPEPPNDGLTQVQRIARELADSVR